MNCDRVAQPWARPSSLYSTPRSLILKLALGEAPEAIPSFADVRCGFREPASKIDGGGVDRVVRHYAAACRVSRVHAAAASLGRPGQGNKHFNGLEHAIGLSRTFRIELEDDCCVFYLIDALRHLAVVEEAYPHYFCTLPFMGDAASVSMDTDEAWLTRDQVRASEALAYEAGDPAVVVAVLDTGVMSDHPELRDRLRRGFDTVHLQPSDVPPGIQLQGDTAGPDPEPTDEVGHGSACAAIIGARGDHIPPGLAGDCGLMPVRVLGAALFPGKKEVVGLGGIADIDRGFKMALDLGAKVLNCSFGSPMSGLDPSDPAPHKDLVDYALARGCILVAASGNSGKEEQFSPAALDGVIAVGAVGSDDRPARFSTSGPQVALSAPGERVVSAALSGYARVTGTSFAAPFVAAAAALLVARAESRAFPLDAAAVKRILCESARPFPADVPPGNGAGVLDACAALQRLDREIDRARDPEGLSRGQGAADNVSG